jgi:excisionase family DNA binding protein
MGTSTGFNQWFGEPLAQCPICSALVPNELESIGKHQQWHDSLGDAAPRTESARGPYSVPEAAALLGCSPATLYRQVNAGKIGAIKMGKRVMIPAHVVDDLVNGHSPRST